MIENFSLIDKTYNDLMEDALYRIPLLCSEWTNFNPSDPGLTVIESLSAMNLIQETAIDELTEFLKMKMLGLLGFERIKRTPAEVFVRFESHSSEPMEIPAGTPFTCDESVFEVENTVKLYNNPLKRVFGVSGLRRRDISRVLDVNNDSLIDVFPEDQEEGSELYFIFDAFGGEEVVLYFDVDDNENERNNLGERPEIVFSKMKWQLYTENGWEDMDVEDNTRLFMYDGCIVFKKGEKTPAVFDDLGFAVRCLLLENNYDITPQVRNVFSNVFRMKQKKTLAGTFDFAGGDRHFTVCTNLLKNGSFAVYRRDGEYYRFCSSCEREQLESKNSPFVYSVIARENYRLELEFANEIPAESDCEIKVVIYGPAYAGRENIGEVYAYDGQTVELDTEDVITSDFELILQQNDENGEAYYSFVRPDTESADGFLYTIADDNVKILKPGIASEGWLISSRLSQIKGGMEELIKNAGFMPGEYEPEEGLFVVVDNPQVREAEFISVASSVKGKEEESAEDMRSRFIKDFSHTATAVTREDYETIVMETPGLAIKKVKAGVDYKKNLVKLVVLPISRKPFPILSEQYKKVIMSNVNRYRLLTTNVVLEEPKYVPLVVSGSVYVKAHYSNAEGMISELLDKELNFIEGEHGFGEKLPFSDIYSKLEKLPCVEYIYNLSISVQGDSSRKTTGEDLQFEYNELCFLKELSIQLIDRI
ncbi:MAG: baseplate J/gp47 family protein [Clostridia bacterium]|nr:baseplate J/gp47 family protein [Clostridia bacterium]